MSEPTILTGDEDGDAYTMITWHYGPQGHPASLSLTLYQDAENLQLWEHGPLVLGRCVTHDDGFLLVMERVSKLGERIESRFGHDWRWHVCQPGCVGWSGDEPPYKRCQECAAVQLAAEVDARQLFAEVLT